MRRTTAFKHALVGGAAVLTLTAIAAPSHAAQFDPATGTLALQGPLGWNFDSLAAVSAGLSLRAEDPDAQALEDSDVEGRFSQSAATIEGRSGLYMGNGLERLGFTFDDPAPLTGRRVQISFWQRPRGVAASATVAWRTTGANGQPFYVGMIRLTATGRRTSDGWYEVSSGPFDFALGGRIVPTLSVRIERGGMAYGPSITTDPEGTTLVDALDIEDLGPAAVTAAKCTLDGEAAGACGQMGTCHLGRCADSAAVYGQIPAEALRGEYLDRRIFEIQTFNGNRVLDHTWAAYHASMEKARAAKSPGEFWTAVTDAYEVIGDGHGAPPTTTYTERPASGLCVHLGAADRLPNNPDGSTRLLPLVFYKDAAVASTATLQVGDVLEQIDGKPVDLWKTMAAGRLRHYGSLGSREVNVVPSLPAAAIRLGATMTFARCPAAIAATRACTAEEVEHMEINAYDLGGKGLWEDGSTSSWVGETVACDMRFQRLTGPTPDNGYMHAAKGDDGDIRILEFNGVPDVSWSPDWTNTVTAAVQGPLTRMLLDERTGDGGTFNAVDLIINPFFATESRPTAEVFPVLNRALDADTREQFVGCENAGGQCGNFILFTPGNDAQVNANAGLSSDAKVAMLVSMDVSGNDYLTRMLKFRPAALSRVFGPCPTFGAFGSIYSLATYLGEMTGGSSQMGDTIMHAVDPPQDLSQFESGPGVAPDELVYQTQSDLVAGRDTLVEAAKAWLRQ